MIHAFVVGHYNNLTLTFAVVYGDTSIVYTASISQFSRFTTLLRNACEDHRARPRTLFSLRFPISRDMHDALTVNRGEAVALLERLEAIEEELHRVVKS